MSPQSELTGRAHDATDDLGVVGLCQRDEHGAFEGADQRVVDGGQRIRPAPDVVETRRSEVGDGHVGMQVDVLAREARRVAVHAVDLGEAGAAR